MKSPRSSIELAKSSGSAPISAPDDRKFGLFAAFRRAFGVYRSGWLSLTGCGAIAYILGIAAVADRQLLLDVGLAGWVFKCANELLFVISHFLIYFIVTQKLTEGRSPTPGQILRVMATRFVPFLLVYLIVYPDFIAEEALRFAASPNWVAVDVSVGIIMILTTMFLVVAPVIIVSGIETWNAALVRAFTLLRGHRLKLFLYALIQLILLALIWSLGNFPLLSENFEAKTLTLISSGCTILVMTLMTITEAVIFVRLVEIEQAPVSVKVADVFD